MSGASPVYGCKHGMILRWSDGSLAVQGSAADIACSLWETHRAVVDEKDAEIAALREAINAFRAGLAALTACPP